MTLEQWVEWLVEGIRGEYPDDDPDALVEICQDQAHEARCEPDDPCWEGYDDAWIPEEVAAEIERRVYRK